MNILALGSHPDDIEYGCGGTLIKYADAGHRIFLMVMTDGGAGGDRDTRRQEQEAAATLIGAQECFWGGYRDTEVPLDRPHIIRLEETIARVEPTFIFVHWPDDTHQDHRNLATSTITATRYTRNVLFYEALTTQNFSPSVFVDIDDVLDRKVEALNAHTSQLGKTHIEDLNITALARSAANFRGIQARVRYAEGFVPLRLFINVDEER